MTGINAVLLLLTVARCEFAGADDDLKNKLQAIYNEADGLIVKKDLKALGKYMGETRTIDYVFEGKGTKANLQQSVRAMFTVLSGFDKVEKATVQIVAFAATGTTATASIRTMLVLKTKPIDKVVHTVEEDVYGTDTWVKQRGNWRLKVSKVTTERILRDGKALPS